MEQPLIDTGGDRQTTGCDRRAEQTMRSPERRLREYLNPVYDLERLISRISYQSANPRDLIAFKTSLAMLPPYQISAGRAFSHRCCRSFRNRSGCAGGSVCSLIEQCHYGRSAACQSRRAGSSRKAIMKRSTRLRNAKTEGKTWLARAGSRRTGKDRDQKSEDQIQQGIRLLSGSDQFL